MTSGGTRTAPPDRKTRPHPDARTMLAEMLDPASFRTWDTAPVDVPATDDYARTLDKARVRSGVDEAVLTGEGT